MLPRGGGEFDIADIAEQGMITLPFKDISKKAEKEYLTRLLKQVKGNKSQATRIMGVDYKTLCAKLKEYSIQN